MANGRDGVAVREVKRQCRTPQFSAEHNTCVRIADDSQLLSCFPRFGKHGKTSEMRSIGRRWRKPMSQFGGKVWLRKMGEDGVSSFLGRSNHGIFVGHHDRTGAVLCITNSVIVRGKSDKTGH